MTEGKNRKMRRSIGARGYPIFYDSIISCKKQHPIFSIRPISSLAWHDNIQLLLKGTNAKEWSTLYKKVKEQQKSNLSRKE